MAGPTGYLLKMVRDELSASRSPLPMTRSSAAA